MSKSKKEKKKVEVQKPLQPTRSRASAPSSPSSDLIFGKANFKIVGIAVGLIILGMLLMSGGSMKDPSVWDDSVIYSFRRITLAPMVILAGLGVGVYAIFKK